ncbi:MAG: heterodisulfide reductase-related iron-sulfur binding cluster [Alphaproteobacteria bacterium]
MTTESASGSAAGPERAGGREGGLAAPMRHPIPWQDESWTDPAALDAELRRVFDICHGCRRCFNLCDSFPRLFDLIDESDTGELDSVASEGFKPVVDACTLCDMCFMTKCPYVPPHEFDLDFPHLMLRARAVEAKKGIPVADRELARTDRNGRVMTSSPLVAGLANWASRTGNRVMRKGLEAVAGVDAKAHLPAYARRPLVKEARRTAPAINRDAPGFGRKAVLYATCYGNWNDSAIGQAARAVLAKNGVESEVVHPGCCGMPVLEQGRMAEVADSAREIAHTLAPWIADGYDVIALVPSCALMLKFEWPLILPGNDQVESLARATFDLAEYVVALAKGPGLAPGLGRLERPVTLHLACHARAQNMGAKAAEMLRLIPDMSPAIVERCSGHGGAWGIKKGNFDTALKVGKPVARQAAKGATETGALVSSECPLAGAHILQGVERLAGDDNTAAEPAAGRQTRAPHPIEILAAAYGLADLPAAINEKAAAR